MNIQLEAELRNLQLATVGKILAGFSHELKNHLAIINESAGLMADLLAVKAADEEKVRSRFKQIIETIEERIKLANIMAQHLNGFAHRMDTPESVFQVNGPLVESLSFLERIVRLKKITLEAQLRENMPKLKSNPAIFQFIFFCLFIELISRLDKEGKAKVSSSLKGTENLIAIKTVGPRNTSGSITKETL
ncbi:MAG: hypothetical protein M8357_08805, partial [Desulfobulbaceae bacterium]|nr:hypothetical protein [Desulfobulbaceae bacterium]